MVKGGVLAHYMAQSLFASPQTELLRVDKHMATISVLQQDISISLINKSI